MNSIREQDNNNKEKTMNGNKSERKMLKYKKRKGNNKHGRA